MTIDSPTPNGAVFTIRLGARADNLMLVRQAVEGAVVSLGAGEQLVNDIKLAVTEACSNVVKYAYNGDEGSMVVSLDRNGPDLQIVVRDFGEWRDRSDRPADEISGMGIPLIKSVTERQKIARLEDGTAVTMIFSLNGDAGDGSE